MYCYSRDKVGSIAEITSLLLICEIICGGLFTFAIHLVSAYKPQYGEYHYKPHFNCIRISVSAAYIY